jgi:hypothetical protein
LFGSGRWRWSQLKKKKNLTRAKANVDAAAAGAAYVEGGFVVVSTYSRMICAAHGLLHIAVRFLELQQIMRIIAFSLPLGTGGPVRGHELACLDRRRLSVACIDLFD